jgi:capsular exopolysaccharide synthesis family protein
LSTETVTSPLIDGYDGESASGTEFRRLLHNLLNHSDLPDGGKTFLVTSATTGEGKSTVVAHLAVTAAIYKLKRTLLIDADLRRPTIHDLFGLHRNGGLTDVIHGSVKLEDSFQRTSIENLSVLSSGTFSDNPTQLFDSQQIHEIIEACRFYYDLIIIDCAPIIPVSDALLLGRDVDGLLVVIKAGETPREVCKRACNLVAEAGGNLLGVALNNVKEALPYYYNYRYYGYKYQPKK